MFHFSSHQNRRTFEIARAYNVCPNDLMWFMVAEELHQVCGFDQVPSPSFLYTPEDKATKFETAGKTIRNKRKRKRFDLVQKQSSYSIIH